VKASVSKLEVKKKKIYLDDQVCYLCVGVKKDKESKLLYNSFTLWVLGHVAVH
jgi:hypothetical protein